MDRVYGIYGASGYGRETMPLLEDQLSSLADEKHAIYYIDDNIKEPIINNRKVLSFNEFLRIDAHEYNVAISISNSKTREHITNKCLDHNCNLINIKAENSLALTDVSIDDGFILSPFVTLTSNIKIGKSFQANIYSYVAHDCIIGDYVTFAPSVKCNGNIVIGDHTYIGTGAIIKQGQPNKPLIIGKGVTIAAGAFVNKNIPDGMTVFGNPAIEMTRENLRKRNG